VRSVSGAWVRHFAEQDEAVTKPHVWISAISQEIAFDGHAPGEHWSLVGEIDTDQESDFYTYIQVLIGLRRTTRGPAAFYLDGHPDNAWVQSEKREPFWVAIDPWGDMRPHIHGARPTFYVSSARATVTGLTRRPPEAHPGRTERTIKVPIKLKHRNGAVFDRWVQAEV